MAAPLPSEFAAIVPVDPDNPTCAELRVLMTTLPSLLERWFSSWYAADGSLTEEFAAQLCDENCSGSDSSSTT